MSKFSEKPGLTWEVICETSQGRNEPLCSCLTEDGDVGFRPLPQRRQTTAQLGGCRQGVLVGEPAVLTKNYLQECWEEGKARERSIKVLLPRTLHPIPLKTKCNCQWVIFFPFLLNIKRFINRVEQWQKKMYSEKLKRERIKSSISLKKKKNHRTVVVLSSSPVTCLACFLLTSPRKGSNSPLLPNSSGVSCCHSHAAECPDHQLHERKMSTSFWICSSKRTHYDQRAPCTCISELIPAPNGW